MIVLDWEPYAPYFSRAEFACRHTGKCGMQSEFLDVLLAIRKEYGRPMHISSGYRDRLHPVEAKKATTGEHPQGLCADVAIQGADALRLIEIALRHGIRRIGVQQKGAGRFVHLGLGGPGLPTPAIWSY